MGFYERYEKLCAEKGLKPQAREMLKVLDIKSPAVSGWKKGAIPKTQYICALSKYFGVSVDYLLGLSEIKNPGAELTGEEKLLLAAYQNADTQGRFRIIQACMNERGVTDDV